MYICWLNALLVWKWEGLGVKRYSSMLHDREPPWIFDLQYGLQLLTCILVNGYIRYMLDDPRHATNFII